MKCLGLILLLLQCVLITVKADDDGYMQCENTVKKWASSSASSEVIDDKKELRDLLFFLHVPRTGGRTYYHCFLKHLYPISQECPPCYDKLRIDPSNPHCKLLTSHDDYSLMSKLRKEKTSLMTILRNPIDRVFSAYEFSVEVAARFVRRGNVTSKLLMLGNTNGTGNGGGSTLDIWPWKYLTPWMIQDLSARMDTRKLKGEPRLKTNDPYNMEDVLMPLHEYINHPMARDIIHNGATFQIAGLTNNSYFEESHEVRHCVLRYQNLGEYVLQVAKRRLDEMLYVGLTDHHRETATMFANVAAANLLISNHTTTNSSYKHEDNDFQRSELKNISLNQLTVARVMDEYDSCISSMRTTHKNRSISSLQNIFPANFSHEARSRVPEATIKEIESLNRLDMELYKYGKDIFAKQQGRTITGSSIFTERLVSSAYSYFYSSPYWRLWCLSITAFLLFLSIFFFVNARRTTHKLKL